ncbi:MAG TPA: hypothetical protein VGE74_06210 [Gemmata sp.]
MAFDNQDDADTAVLQLRLAGFRDSQIGYAGRLRGGRMLDLLERDRSFGGAVLGSIVGAALGVALTPALAWLLAPATGAHDLFGLGVTSAVSGAMFLGFLGGWIGMSLHRNGVDVPATGPADGPFILAVAAGDAHNRAWEILHRRGHDLLPAPLNATGPA